MTSIPHTSEIYKEKRKPKTPIKFNITLNDEQKECKNTILSSAITVIKGAAGSGKTLVGIQTGLDLLFTRQVNKIIIARPYVTAGEDIGYFPGGANEKLSYLTLPIHIIVEDLVGKDKLDSLLKEGRLEVFPFGFLRGNTFTDNFILIDEAQNATLKQTELMIGRLGKNSKMVFCGDMSQCDLPYSKKSGFPSLDLLVENIEEVNLYELKTNHRHGVVEKVLKIFKEHELGI